MRWVEALRCTPSAGRAQESAGELESEERVGHNGSGLYLRRLQCRASRWRRLYTFRCVTRRHLHAGARAGALLSFFSRHPLPSDMPAGDITVYAFVRPLRQVSFFAFADSSAAFLRSSSRPKEKRTSCWRR